MDLFFRKAGFVLIAGLVMWLGLAGPGQAAEGYAALVQRVNANPPGGVAFMPDVEAAILAGTNAYRRSKGLPALKPADENLVQAARAQALDLLQTGSMGHTSSDGRNFESRMRALNPGQMFLPAMAENAARQRKPGLSDMEKANDIVQQWIKSGSHRRSLANRSYVSVAIGAVKRGDHIYAVQIFMGPKVKTNMNLNISN